MRIISASAGSMAGVTVADGELLARRRRWHAGKRAGSVCQTAGKPGRGVVGVVGGGWEVGFGGWRSGGAEGGRGCVVRIGGCFVFAESDGIWQRSSALTWPTLTSNHPARPSGSKNKHKQAREKTVIHPDILPSHESIK